MIKILLAIIIISTIIVSGCSSYNAEFLKCKEIKVKETDCKRFTRFTCDNRTIDFELEKQCYNEIRLTNTTGG